MESIGAFSPAMAEDSVNADIRRYTAAQISRDYRLSRLEAAAKVQIEKTLLDKSDGM